MSPASVERVEEIVHARQRPVAGAHEQVAALERRPRGGAAVDHAAHEQAVALGQPDGGAHPARHARRRQRDAEPRPLGRLAARQLADAAAQGGVGRQGEDEAAVAADGVEAEQVAGGVDQRAAGRAARQRRGVLDRAGHAPPARAAEAAPGRGDEAEGRAQPAAAGVGEREHRRAGRRRVAGLPGDGLRVAGVDGDDRHVEVGVRAGHAPLGRAAVGERDRDLVAAQHVRDGQHLAGGDDDAGAAAPAAPEPDHRRADLCRRVRHRLLESFEYLVHALLTCNLQVTLSSVGDGTNFGH